MSKPDLVVAPCSYEAAKYAVMHWHYSQAMPAGKLVKFGAWEGGQFIGCVLFGRGACNELLTPYGLTTIQGCELVRIALFDHCVPVTMIVSRALGLLKASSYGMRIVVSFADPRQTHHGGIYQSMNWLYVGVASGDKWISINGKAMHPRSLYSKLGTRSIDYIRKHVDSGAHFVDTLSKHKYLYPLDKAMRRQIEPLAKPYPKRADVCEIESS